MKKTIFIFYLIFISYSLFAEKYYWVGGSGKWSELNHWSPVSGSTSVFHGVIPTYNDTLYFDQNSFSAAGQTVTIDVSNAICMQMDWKQALYQPTLTNQAGSNLSIYGSLYLSPEMNFNFSGKIYFEALKPDNKIITYGKNLGSQLLFNGITGEWKADTLLTTADIQLNGDNARLEMLGNLTTSAYIFINAGTLICQNKTIAADRFIIGGARNKTLEIENTLFQIKTRWLVENTGLTLHNAHTVYTFSQAAEFYGGEGFSYQKIHFLQESSSVRFQATTCTVDTLICNGSVRISGNNNLLGYVSIAGDAIFEGSNSFDKLLLAQNKNYSFESAKNQTIITEIVANGSCEGFTYLHSSGAEKAILYKQSGYVNLEHVLIENIEAQGAFFTAQQSAGLKVTTGWTIHNTPRTLFWVGGNGKWNETAHWSLTSGGAGGQCVPFHTDNVIFNDQSFPQGDETVEVLTPKAYCNDLLWFTTTGNPRFYTQSDKMRLFGSLRLSPNMRFHYNGEFHFLSENAGNTITSAAHTFRKEIFFAGNGGEWTLQDSLATTMNDIDLQKGTLKTNSQKVKCKTFFSSNANERGLILENSVVEIHDAWKTGSSSNFNFDSGTSLIKMFSASAKVEGGSELVFHNILFIDSIGNATVESAESIYTKVIFSGNGNFKGKNFFDTLQLTPAKVYKLDHQGELYVNTLVGEGSCSGYIVLQSNLSGTRAKIAKNEGSLNMNYLILKDIDATKVVGGFFAANSIDMGNNLGCNILDAAGQNIYWVGNTGNWADQNNWSYQSGGAGGACVPSPADNVFFDVNSFSAASQVVTIDIAEAFCKSMNWTGSLYNPEIENLGTSTLFIYNSLMLIEDMNWNYFGKIVFESDKLDNQITSAGKILPNQVYFQGNGGVWTLNDSLTVSQTLTLTSGRLRTQSHALNLGNFISSSGQSSVLEVDNSQIDIADKWTVSGDFKILGNQFDLRFNGGLSFMQNDATDSLMFNNVHFTVNSSDCSIKGSAKQYFKNITFAGKGELSGSGQKILDTLKIKNAGKITNFNKIKKAVFYAYAQIWDFSDIDTLLILTYGDVTGKNNIRFLEANSNVTFTGTNTLGYCKLNGDGDFFGKNVFDTLIFTPDKRYELQGGISQTILGDLKIRGNHCRHIYVLSSNSQIAYFEKAEGSIKGDFLEMQNIGGKGGATFYAGNFNHSDNIDNSCVGWIFDDQPGYIYGLSPDTIMIDAEKTIIGTQNLNGDAQTYYLWSTGHQGNELEISQAGKYSVTAVYGMINGQLCTFTDDILVHFAKVSPPKCPNEANGSIELITYDNALHTFLWNDGSTASLKEFLPKGEYTIKITETASGRTAQRSISLPNGLLININADISHPTCFGLQNGTIDLSSDNATQPIIYKWLNYNDLESNHAQNLPSGEYIIQITDAFCSNVDTFLVIQPEKLSLTLESKNSCTNSQGGEVIAHAQGGTPDYFFHWKDFPTSSDSVLLSLSGEKYVVLTLTDANNCSPVTDSVWLAQPPVMALSLAQKEDERCFGENNGSLFLNINGGSANFDIILDNQTHFSTQNIQNIGVGKHFLQVFDARNCSDTLSFDIKPAPQPQIDITTTNSQCGKPTGNIQFLITHTRPTPEIVWTNAQGTSVQNLSALNAGKYYLRFTDSKNCVYTDSAEILTSDCNSFIEVPNVFTPNEDGANDVFMVNWSSLLTFKCVITNRWGRKVHEFASPALGWNGRLNGSGNLLSDGVYYYVIKALGEDGKVFDLQGSFYLYF